MFYSVLFLQSSSSNDGSSALVRDLEQSLKDCECKLKRKEEVSSITFVTKIPKRNEMTSF